MAGGMEQDGGRTGTATEPRDTSAFVQNQHASALAPCPVVPPRVNGKPAAKKKPQPVLPVRLKKEDVRYLALEGGGGKGVAYLGAIEALERLQGSQVLT